MRQEISFFCSLRQRPDIAGAVRKEGVAEGSKGTKGVSDELSGRVCKQGGIYSVMWEMADHVFLRASRFFP